VSGLITDLDPIPTQIISKRLGEIATCLSYECYPKGGIELRQRPSLGSASSGNGLLFRGRKLGGRSVTKVEWAWEGER
jgi:hypothetical protein